MRQKKLGVALTMGLAVLFGVGAVLGTIAFWQAQAINSTFQVALADGERWTGEGQEAALAIITDRLALFEAQANLPAGEGVALNQTATGFRLTVPQGVSQEAVLPLLTWLGETVVIDGGIEFPPVSLETPIKVGATAQPSTGVYGVVITQGDIIEVTPLPQADSAFGLRLQLTEAGYARYNEFISRNQGVYLCVVVDNYVVACPVLRPAERVDPAAQQAVDMLPGPTDILLDETLLLALLNTEALPGQLQLVE
jgi:hypothetical protein